MKSIWNWFLDSNRYLHFLGGMFIGVISDDAYCATVAGTCTAGALEFKDCQWGGKPDVVDFLMTIAGVAFGFVAKQLILGLSIL